MTKQAIPLAIALCAAAVVAGLATPLAAQGRRGGYTYTTGKDLYEHICQGCHMPDAKGATGAGAYPALAGDRRLQAGLYPVTVILRGQRAMPAFSELNDDQVAAVTNYVSSNFGNSFPGEVTADQVKTLRSQAVHQDAQRPG